MSAETRATAFPVAHVPEARLHGPSSYVSAYFHGVFSTRERRLLITPSVQERLWPFLGGIAREHGMKALRIGGVGDRVHLLLSLPATLPIAKAMQRIKGGSAKWIHETFPEHRETRAGRRNTAL